MANKTIFLLSNASTDIYNNNTLTKFTNHFENPINLEQGEKWQIGLQSIFLHPLFPNIPFLDDKPHIKIVDELTVHNIFLPYKRYSSKSLVHQINERLSEAGLKSKLHFTLNEDSNKIELNPAENFQAELSVHKHFIKTMGFHRINQSVDYVTFAISESPRHEVKLSDQIPKIIKVQVSHTADLFESNNQTIFISYHAVNMISPFTHHFFSERPLYLAVTSNPIKDFTVTIVDEHNNQLKLGNNIPTIIQLNMTRSNEESGEFHVVVDSSMKNENYPNNSTADFCFSLNPPIHLSEDYVCSINSITFPTRFRTIFIQNNNFYLMVQRTVDNIIRNVRLPFNQKGMNFLSIEELIEGLNNTFGATKPDSTYFPPNNVMGTHLLKIFTLEAYGGEKKLHFTGYKNTIYDFPIEIASVLGLNDKAGKKIGNRWLIEMNDMESDDPILGMQSFEMPPNIITLIPQSLFIYTDFTQLVSVGNNETNLLQIVPIRSNVFEREKNQFVTENFDRPNWIQIRTRILNNLRFKILRSDGQLITFDRKDDGIVIVLAFKKMYYHE